MPKGKDMAILSLKAKVVAVHGEGDRDMHKKYVAFDTYAKESNGGRKAMPLREVDPQAEVLAILRIEREDGREARLEMPLHDWAEVDAFKALPGVWDTGKKQFVAGAEVSVTIGA